MTTVASVFQSRLGSRARVVAGQDGLDAQVSWAVTARTRTPALDPLQGGEVVLLPAGALSTLGGDAALASLVSGFKAGGAAAVCLWSEPDAAGRASADRVALPLIVVRDTPPAELERTLIDEITSRMRNRLRQQQDRQTLLLESLAGNRGLDGLIRVLAGHVGRQALYLPVGGQPLLSDGVAPVLPPDLAARAMDPHQVESLPDADGPGRLWVTPVTHRGNRVGVLVVRGARTEPTPGEALSMRQTASAVSVEQGRLDAAAEAEQRLRDGFYKDLFAGRAPDTLYGRARSLGVTLPAEGVVALLGAQSAGDPLPEAAKDRVHALLDRQASYPILDQGKSLLVLIPHLLRGDNAVSLLLRSLAATGGRVAVGVSDPLRDLQGIPDAVQEADTALLVSRRTRGGAVTRFSETGAFGLLAPLRETAVARRVIGQLLEPLLAYDEQHNAALTETLQTYIACNGNASMTAGRLNLHRNSLSYRLRRIEELAGLSLGDAENRLLLALALRLHQLR